MPRLTERFVSRLHEKADAVRAWEGDDPKRQRRTYWRFYTLAFLLVCAGIVLLYFSNLRSFVWSVDGMEQYYPFFVYEGQLIRETVGGLLSGEGLAIPLWSYEVGFGTDIPSTLDVFFDPLNLLSGLCPEQYSEYLFQALIIVRFYLAGVTFSLFAFRFASSRFSVLVGAVLYAFCATSFEAFLWPASMWPMILFPLLLLGVEKVIAGERPYVFLAAASLFFVISYYFSYMACILLVPYCAARVIVTGAAKGPAGFLAYVAKFAGLLIVGMCIAGVSLVPSVMALLGLDRVSDTSVTVPLLYSATQILNTIGGFIGTANVGSDCYMGFGAPAVLACALLFMRKRENRLLKAAFIAGSLMLLIPVAGSIMNGFNYATNRWVWAYALLVCGIVVKLLPGLLTMSASEKRRMFVIACVVSVLIVVIPTTRTEQNGVTLGVMFALMIVLFWRDLSCIAKRAAVGICVVAGVWVSAVYFIAPDENGWAKSSPSLTFMYDHLTELSPNWLVANIDDEGLWRYDADMASSKERTRNDSAVLGLMGIDFYNSAYNSYIDRYFTELGVPESEINFSYKHFGDRPILDTLAGVKYFIVKDGVTPPFNYNDPARVVASGTTHDISTSVYQGTDTLPLAYTYGRSISRERYEALSPAQKQEALLQAVVLDDASKEREQAPSDAPDASAVPAVDLALTQQEIPYQIVSTENLEVQDGRIIAKQGGAKLTLAFDGLADCETYVAFDNLNYRGLSPRERMSDEEYDALAWYRKLKLAKADSEWTEPAGYFVYFASDTGWQGRFVQNWSQSYHLYGGKSDWLANMGYSADGQTHVTITFSQDGEYAFDGLSVICQPVETFDDRVNALKADPVEGLAFDTNKITGSVDLDAPKAVYFSVAYSEGWQATVDGAPAKVYRANTGFMAVVCDEGAHDIELTYRTPGLNAGIALTCFGIVVVAAIALLSVLRSKSKRK